MIRKLSIITTLLLLSSVLTCQGNHKTELTVFDAIEIAKNIANEKNYPTDKVDVEIIKVGKEIERGPIRLVWLMRYFSMQEIQVLLENDFWIVFFYPKGQLEKPTILGGDFCVLVDSSSGKILASFKGE